MTRLLADRSRWGIPLVVAALVLWVRRETHPALAALTLSLIAAAWVMAWTAPWSSGRTLARWIERRDRWFLIASLALVFGWGLMGALVRFPTASAPT